MEQKESAQCGNLNPPEDKYCKKSIFELKEYNLEDFKIKEPQRFSLNIMIIVIMVIGFLTLITFALMIQYFVQEIIPLLILLPIEITFILSSARYFCGFSK